MALTVEAVFVTFPIAALGERGDRTELDNFCLLVPEDDRAGMLEGEGEGSKRSALLPSVSINMECHGSVFIPV